MQIQLGQIEGNQEKCFFAAIRTIAFGRGDFVFHVATGFFHGLGKHRYVFVRAFDTVKRSLGLVAHNCLSDHLPFGGAQ